MKEYNDVAGNPIPKQFVSKSPNKLENVKSYHYNGTIRLLRKTPRDEDGRVGYEMVSLEAPRWWLDNLLLSRD